MSLIQRFYCHVSGHDYKTHLMAYPRPGPAPGFHQHRVCQRCGHAPDCTVVCDI